MYIFAKNGFLSIVQDRNDPKLLMVRGRVKGDLEHYFPKYPVTVTPDGDYLYRISAPRDVVAVAVVDIVREINYDRFKPAVADKRREIPYLECFFTLEDMQRDLNQHDHG